MLRFLMVSLTILASPHFQILGKEMGEQCSSDAPAANKIREKVANLQNAVERYICSLENDGEAPADHEEKEPATTVRTADACKKEFEPSSADKNKRIIICALRSEDINAQFTVNRVNEKLCTHVLLSGYIKVDAKTTEITENKIDTHNLSDMVTQLKGKKLKIWLSIGADGTLGPEEYSAIANTEKSRTKFVQNVMNIVSTYGFDGFSPRWKYPACPWNVCLKLIKQDFANYVRLMEAFSLMLRPKGLSLVAYGTNWFMLNRMFDFAALKKFIDYWLIACFNSEGHWSTTAGIASGQKFYEDCFGRYSPVIPIETALIGISISYSPVKLLRVTTNTIGSGIRKDVIGNSKLKSFRGVCTAVNSLNGKLVHNETDKLNVYYTNDTDWVSVESTMSIRQKESIKIMLVIFNLLNIANNADGASHKTQTSGSVRGAHQ
ncbi:probable chitinase 10 [Cloeon dipterum]|uniref:probable chitinase 10 n=1 Tax=Cloeon dipterum TaxID=197152 RepID=UPI0032208BDF